MGTLGSCESLRSTLQQKIAEDLASLHFQISCGATWSCSIEKVHSAEAPQHCLDSKLQKLLARNSDLLVKMAVQRVLKSRAASQLVSLFLLLYTIELARFYVLAAALLSIGVFLSFEGNKDDCSAVKHCQ